MWFRLSWYDRNLRLCSRVDCSSKSKVIRRLHIYNFCPCCCDCSAFHVSVLLSPVEWSQVSENGCGIVAQDTHRQPPAASHSWNVTNNFRPCLRAIRNTELLNFALVCVRNWYSVYFSMVLFRAFSSVPAGYFVIRCSASLGPSAVSWCAEYRMHNCMHEVTPGLLYGY